MDHHPVRQDLASLAVLAEPIRRRLYEYVAARPGPVDRDEAAEGVGIARALAAFHLDRLAAAGLLGVVYRRRSGRTGPGAGRPAKFYLRPADREIGVSLPPRAYGLAAAILAEGVQRRPDVADEVLTVAREQGRRLAEGHRTNEPGAAALVELLAAHGYEPMLDVDGAVRLRNCPFHALVERHRPLTCAMNLAMLEGVAEGTDGGSLVPTPQPRDGFCCVAFVPATPRHDASPAPSTD